MPRKKDKNGKVYVWSDDGYAMYFQYYKAIGGAVKGN